MDTAAPHTTPGVRSIDDCRVCGGTEWQHVVSLGDQPLANGYLDPDHPRSSEPRFPLGVVSCRTCRLLSLTHVVDPGLLYRHYAYLTSESDTITEHMRRVAEICTCAFAVPAGSLVVEIGSNTGAQLREFVARGMRPLGIDPARNIAARANAQGIPTMAEFFDAATARAVVAEHGRARLLLGRHVFAHIDDIADVLAAATTLLDADGVFAIEVPYALDVLEECEFDTIYHEHLSYFALSPLRTLFERHGMRLLDVRRVGVHGGSILVMAGPADGPWPTRDSVAELLALEEQAGLFDDAVYVRFAERVEQIRTELEAMVRGLVADGHRVAAYGASAKGNMILNACGFGPDELEFCSDTTDLKQGRLLPGTGIPVLSPEQARRRPPDYYLLTAWNYAEEILRKEQPYLAAGGAFILPIPRPTIVTAAG